MIKKYYPKLLFIAIFSLAAFLRLYGINWDQNLHLHPDERFLTMVGNAMRLPHSFAEYFDPSISPFNPNNIGFKFFVYGIFPLTVNKLVAIFLQNDTYNLFTIQGRILSALCDLGTLFSIYKLTIIFEKKYKIDSCIKYYAIFFYGISVLPIQISHFFIVDPFLNFFLFSGFYFLVSAYFSKNVMSLIVSSILFGLALGTKINALLFIPLYASTGLLYLNRRPQLKSITNLTLLCFLYILISYGILRITDPYLFESVNLFNPTPSSNFIESISLLQSWNNKDALFPPGVQWINKTPLFGLVNIGFFGVGIPYFIISLFGIFHIMKRHRNTFLLIIVLYCFLLFVYQSTQYVKTMRYFIFLYPFFAFFSGVGLHLLYEKRGYIFKIIIVVLIIIWPLSFFSIYIHNHTRYDASSWIYKNLPNNTMILGEYWDDPLPLYLDNTYGKSFNIQLLHSFDLDTKEKWQETDTLLKNADYLVLSSNRGWGSIPTAPERYPRMSRFYQDLFKNKLSYKKIIEFTSYPSLTYLGIPLTISDDWAEEAFTVHDHPKVIIFQNIKK